MSHPPSKGDARRIARPNSPNQPDPTKPAPDSPAAGVFVSCPEKVYVPHGADAQDAGIAATHYAVDRQEALDRVLKMPAHCLDMEIIRESAYERLSAMTDAEYWDDVERQIQRRQRSPRRFREHVREHLRGCRDE